MADLTPGYSLQIGSGLDRALLVKFMQKTYQELYPDCGFAHLAQTVEQYLSNETPLWWVNQNRNREQEIGWEETKPNQNPEISAVRSTGQNPIACLWLGNAVDQIQGDRHAYIFLLYVNPEHRRRGIGSALMNQAESWAKTRGDRQIGLQVFHHNQPALHLYKKLGYEPQSLWLVKSLGIRH